MGKEEKEHHSKHTSETSSDGPPPPPPFRFPASARATVMNHPAKHSRSSCLQTLAAREAAKAAKTATVSYTGIRHALGWGGVECK